MWTRWASIQLLCHYIPGQRRDQHQKDWSESQTAGTNAIAAKWNNKVYFMIKEESTTQNLFLEFLKKLVERLKKWLTKKQFECRTVIILDNASIHKTKLIKNYVKSSSLVAFSIIPYSPEMNEIEHTFGKLKTMLSRQNLNSKEFLYVIKREIERM